MLKPSEEIARAIVNLLGDISFERLVTWLEDSLQEQSIGNNRKIGEDTIKGQGRCLELEEILKHINDAPQYLKNIKENDRIKNGGIV